MKANLGDIVRYDYGLTALMQVTHVSTNHGGVADRYYGTQCMGGYVGAYENSVSAASDEDLKTWADRATWREETREKKDSSIVGAVED